MAVVTSLGALGANDTIVWSQLGADATTLTATPTFTSTHSLTGSVTLNGPNSLVAVVCPETLCSWNLGGLTGFATGDSLIWTADTGNSGNGPLTLNFTSKNVSGAGAFIQADGPAQFTANIQAFNGGTSLGSFPVTSDPSGDATFIGVLDSTAANITKVIFSITSCTGDCTDFAIDTVSLKVPGGATPTPTHGDPTRRNPRLRPQRDSHATFGDRNCDPTQLQPRPGNFHRNPTATARNRNCNSHGDADVHLHQRRLRCPRSSKPSRRTGVLAR